MLLDDGTEVGFQEYFVKLHHDVAVRRVRFEGAEDARPGPGVLDAVAGASIVVVCPSNPVVSIDPLLAVPGVAEALTDRRDRTVAVSPIVAGAALKGPADRLLVEMGFESSVVGVARWYARFVSTLVIDEADAALGTGGRGRGCPLRRGPHDHVRRGPVGRLGPGGRRCLQVMHCTVPPARSNLVPPARSNLVPPARSNLAPPARSHLAP